MAAAWAIPIVWIAVALLSGPSDGTAVSPPASMLGEDRWGQSVTVVRTYGDTPLREGDVISRIDDVPIDEWVTDPPDDSRAVGDVVRYEVIRPGAELDQRRVIAVPLTRYPVAEAASRNIVPLALVGMLLAAASVVFWFRPRMPAAVAFLASATLVPAMLTSWPFGLGAIDLAGSRGIWPHLVGEALCAIGIGTLLLTALVFVAWPRGARGRWALPVAYGVPLAGYAAWALLGGPVAGARRRSPPGPHHRRRARAGRHGAGGPRDPAPRIPAGPDQERPTRRPPGAAGGRGRPRSAAASRRRPTPGHRRRRRALAGAGPAPGAGGPELRGRGDAALPARRDRTHRAAHPGACRGGRPGGRRCSSPSRAR